METSSQITITGRAIAGGQITPALNASVRGPRHSRSCRHAKTSTSGSRPIKHFATDRE